MAVFTQTGALLLMYCFNELMSGAFRRGNRSIFSRLISTSNTDGRAPSTYRDCLAKKGNLLFAVTTQ
jgi:hypothetical protein